MSEEKDLTVRYALIPAFYWMSFAAVMSFSSYYLLQNGYSNTQIGIVAAVAGVISAILQPLIAGYADGERSPSLKIIELVIVVIVVLLAGIMLLLTGRSFLMVGILYVALITLLQLQTPMVNALGTESMNQGKKMNYGACRSMGSVGYAIMAYLLGIVTAKVGVYAVPIAIMLVYIALFGALLLFPFEKTKRTMNSEPAKNVRRDAHRSSSFFRKYKQFTIVLIGCILIYISHVLINNFTLQIVQSKGGTSAEMGFAQAFASVLELPTIFFFGYLLKKASCDVWFRIAGVFFFLKTFATYLVPNIPCFYAVQILQIFGWALMTVSSVYYVNAIMEAEDTIKGQAYMTMTYTLGTVLGSLIGGALIDLFSVQIMLLAGSIIGAAGMIIILLTTQRTEEVKE